MQLHAILMKHMFPGLLFCLSLVLLQLLCTGHSLLLL
jgi:hypothetical protein